MRNRPLGARLALAGAVIAMTGAASIGLASAGQFTHDRPGVEASLLRLAAGETAPARDFFDAVIPFGFAERAAYDVQLAPSIPLAPSQSPTARLLPFALVLDAVMSRASAHAIDSIVDAQGDRGSAAIYFEQGPVFLADIATAVADLGLPSSSAATPTTLTLSKPLVLSSGAVLVLRAGEQLVLDRAAGAFVIAAGGIIIDRAAIVGTEAANPSEANFRPFVLADASGPVEISGARFEHIGFGQDPTTTGLSIIGTNADPTRRSFVQDSSFIETGSLSLFGAELSTIRRNVFVRPFNSAMAVVTSSSIIIDGNAIIQPSAGHGIKIGPDATNVLVSDNIVTAAPKHGLLLQGDNGGTVIFNNLLFQNNGSGVAVLDGGCIALDQNTLLGNMADGIMVRRSADLAIKANIISGNGRAGISVVGNAGAMTLVDNTFEDNKVGLRASANEALSLANNTWTGQTPRLLDGDIAQYVLPLLDGIRSGKTSLTLAGLPPTDPVNGATCPLGNAV